MDADSSIVRNLVQLLVQVLTSRIYCLADKANSKKSKGKQKKKAAVSSSSPRVDHGYLACQHHRVIVTGLAWIEGFVTTGTKRKKRKEMENVFSVLLSSYRNTRESLGDSIKLWKHSPVGSCSIPTAFLVLPNIHSCSHN